MKNTLTAAVLLIGDELLCGSIQDLNLSHIAVSLESRGIRVRETRIVPDLDDEIVSALNTLRHKYDYVFTTGGIGPTHDDITSDAVAKVFGVKNVIQQEVFDAFKKYLDSKSMDFTPAAQRMAHAPEGAEMIAAKGSAVPGYRIGNVFVMAGVPRIMRAMLEPILETLQQGSTILSGAVHANVSEGEIAQPLAEIQLAHPEVVLGSYPQDSDSERSNYRVIFTVRGVCQKEIDQVCDKILAACTSRDIECLRVGAGD